ncbi:unnamed protein product [Spodoptera exigua]|nr:unnamed protein product [Spodoptera exigua]
MKRIRTAMNMIERVSCVVFKPMAVKAPEFSSYMWLSIENPTRIRRCIHRVLHDKSGKATMIIGYECMQQRDILHSLMHVLGFHDEVTHPHRDNYVRIVWPNIQPQYRSLFSKGFHSRSNDLVEYDTTSIMHFHDRAYTNNGAPTIVPLVSGLKIRELESSLLSQLDVMKLKLAFGNDCNKRNVRKLYETCHAAIGEDKEDNNNANYQDSKDFEDNQYTTDHRAIPEVSDGQGVEELSDGKESFEDLEFRDNIRSQNRQNGTVGQGGHDRAEKAVNPSPSPGVKQHFETLKNTTSKNVPLKS